MEFILQMIMKYVCGTQYTTYGTTYDEHFKINVKIQESCELNIHKNN